MLITLAAVAAIGTGLYFAREPIGRFLSYQYDKTQVLEAPAAQDGFDEGKMPGLTNIFKHQPRIATNAQPNASNANNSAAKMKIRAQILTSNSPSSDLEQQLLKSSTLPAIQDFYQRNGLGAGPVDINSLLLPVVKYTDKSETGTGKNAVTTKTMIDGIYEVCTRGDGNTQEVYKFQDRETDLRNQSKVIDKNTLAEIVRDNAAKYPAMNDDRARAKLMEYFRANRLAESDFHPMEYSRMMMQGLDLSAREGTWVRKDYPDGADGNKPMVGIIITTDGKLRLFEKYLQTPIQIQRTN